MSLHASTPNLPANGHEGIDERFEVIGKSSINKNSTLNKKKSTTENCAVFTTRREKSSLLINSPAEKLLVCETGTNEPYIH